jgi:hypothetical protein
MPVAVALSIKMALLNEVPKRIRAEEHTAADLDIIDTAVKNVISQRLGAYSSTFAALVMSSRPSSWCPLCIDVSVGFVGFGWVDMESSFVAKTVIRDGRAPIQWTIRPVSRE